MYVCVLLGVCGCDLDVVFELMCVCVGVKGNVLYMEYEFWVCVKVSEFMWMFVDGEFVLMLVKVM